MDYGQLAYIKAEEIENYLRVAAAKRTGRNAVSASFYPRCEISGGYEPCSVIGGASTALTVTLTLRAPQGANEIKVRLFCGDKIAAYVTVSLSAGETGRYTMLASVYPSGGEKLRIAASENGLILEQMQILADGDGVTVTGGKEIMRCDFAGDAVYTLTEENGYIYLAKIGGAKVNAAHGSEYDIAVADGGVKVICRDDVGNLWGICYDFDLAEQSRVNLGDAPEKVAIGQNPYGLTVAGVIKDEVYLCECEYDFSGRTDFARAEINTLADDVYLVKQSNNPALIITRDGKLYAKLPMPSTGSRDSISVTLSLETGG